MKNSEASSLGTYYADHRAPAILSQNKERKIGRVFAEYKDKLIIVDGEVKKEHVYLIPKNKVDLYGDNHKRNMPQLMSVMITLRNTVEFRILPLFHEFCYNDLELRYILLSSIRGENATEDCAILASKFGKALYKTRQAVIVSVETKFRSTPKSNVSSDVNVKDVNQSELKRIFDDITGGTIANRRSATISHIRHFSETKRIWKHDISWDMVLDLISFSLIILILKMDCMYLESMIRTSGRTDSKEHENVKKLIRLRFGSRLVENFSYRIDDWRISLDSFVILKEITKKTH